MTYYFRTGGYTLYPQTGELVSDQQRVVIRPKTCQLLVLLLEANGARVNKADMLAQVWDDVIVDEQVVFQSIKEVRKLFAGVDVIKTYPRKGYVWQLPVEKVHPPAPEATPAGNPATKFWLAGLVAVAITATLLWGAFRPPASAPGSILVLPVHTTLDDVDHRWVRYGVMDYVIRHLASSDRNAVLQADDVLAILTRADMPAGDYTAESIERLFKVSGASLIVQQRVTGSPKDYQLIYSLHRRDGINRGAFMSDDINRAAAQLANKVARRLGQATRNQLPDYLSDFGHELMANALVKLQQEDFGATATLLQALVATEPNNLSARRLLVQVLVQGEQFAAAQQVAEPAQQLAAAAANGVELARMQLWHGISLLQQGKLEQGLALLAEARGHAERAHDWLSLGYITEATGLTFQAQQAYGQAETEFQASLRYHQILQCPNGHANGLLNLGALAVAQGDTATARDYFSEALALAQARGLTSLHGQATRWLQGLSNGAR